MNRWYKKQTESLLAQESGMTLVELLASILLLSLIITTFLSFFIQAAKTNNETDAVNEATFIAQEQIELLTYYSRTKSIEETIKLVESESPREESGFQVQSNLIKKQNDTIYTGTVSVSKGRKTYAQMETRLSFRTAAELKK